MMETLIHDILGPVFRRVGTMVGAGLATVGVAESEINVVVGGVVALCGIGADLALRYFVKRR